MSEYNFDRLTDYDSVIVQQTSDRLVIDVDGYRYSFSGTGVRYNGFGEPIAGTITGISISSGGTVQFQVDGFALPAATFYLSTYAPNSPLPLIFAGDDDLRGGDQFDVLLAGEGHNIVMGGDGADSLVAGSGNDHLYGASPDGGPDGNDTILAGSGSDYIQGNASTDFLFGEGGSDRIYGGAGEDRIWGGDGNDTVNGNRDDDTIFGEAGNDVLRGGQGNDTLSGGDGNDVLMGDLGRDRLEGGAGADIFVFAPGGTPVGSSTTYLDNVRDYGYGDDRISIGFMPQAVLVQGPGTPMNDPRDAQIIALRMMNEHPGDGEVAIVYMDANSAVMFWNAAGASTIDSAIYLRTDQLTHEFGFGDFV